MLNNKKIRTLALASIAACASLASAQSNDFGAYALMAHNQLSRDSHQNADVMLQLGQVRVQNETRPILILLGQPNSDSQARFADLNPRGSDHADYAGRTRSGVDARPFAAPKEDGLNVVPLPPATFAGFGLLAGLAGVRYLRQSRR